MKPHKHKDLIIAWANGAKIEWQNSVGDWCLQRGEIDWGYSEGRYRIKPEPKPDHVYYGVFDMDGSMAIESCFTKVNDDGDQIKLTFDGETGKLKAAEVL